MARKKQDAAQPSLMGADGEEIAPRREPAAETKLPKPRLSIALNEDGSIDLSSARADTREKLRAALGSPDLQRELGLAEESVPAVSFSREDCKYFYGALGQFEVWLAVKFGKMDAALAAEIFPYTAGELEILAEPTAAVASKYAGRWMVENSDVLRLSFALLHVHQQKMLRLESLIKKPKQDQALANPVQVQAEAE